MAKWAGVADIAFFLIAVFILMEFRHVIKENVISRINDYEVFLQNLTQRVVRINDFQLIPVEKTVKDAVMVLGSALGAALLITVAVLVVLLMLKLSLCVIK